VSEDLKRIEPSQRPTGHDVIAHSRVILEPVRPNGGASSCQDEDFMGNTRLGGIARSWKRTALM
jgi:hypothetical protein